MRATTSKRGMWVAAVVGLLLVGVGTVCAFNLPGLGKYRHVKVVSGAVSLPVAKVSDGSAHFYKVTDGDREIRFFIVKGADGVLHTAFDACDVCFKEKMGYDQAGDFMVCKNCNQRFATNRIGPHTVGGCNPSYLPAAIGTDRVIIKVADLRAGAGFF